MQSKIEVLPFLLPPGRGVRPSCYRAIYCFRVNKAAPVAGLLLALLAVASPEMAFPAAVQAPGLIDIPGGTFTMGDVGGEPDEAPKTVTVAPFRIMRYEVTNRQFEAFVAATGHITDVERAGRGYVWDRRWRRVGGADWRHPRGRDSRIAEIPNHPVVQVSARDAATYCSWHGLRLPSEVEWEYAARGPAAHRYPWGDEAPQQSGRRRANFGTIDCCAPDPADGYSYTAPVGIYPSGVSVFGLFDMAGNVWEWTSSRFPGDAAKVVLRGGGWGNNPYCLRSAYRHGNPSDIGLDMVGFRCASDPP